MKKSIRCIGMPLIIFALCVLFYQQTIFLMLDSVYASEENDNVNFIGIITHMANENGNVSVNILNHSNNESIDFNIDESTIYNLHPIHVGDVVNVKYNPNPIELIDISKGIVDQDYWEYSDVIVHKNDFEKQAIIDDNYKEFFYILETIVQHLSEDFPIESIDNQSVLMIRGIGNNVLYIEVISFETPSAAGGGYITINIPTGASLYIDDEPYNASREIYLEFNSYKIVVAKDGYEPYERTIKFEDSGEIVDIDQSLLIPVHTTTNPVSPQNDLFLLLRIITWVMGLAILLVVCVVTYFLIRHLRNSRHNAPKKQAGSLVGIEAEETNHGVREEQPIIIARNLITKKKIPEIHQSPAKIKPISFDIYKGDIIYVVGDSGSGKTVLLKMLAGYDKNVHGDLIFGGMNWRRDDKLLKKLIGYVPQKDTLYADLTPKETLKFYSRILLGNKDREAVINEILKDLGLSNKHNEKISKLSGGERKRVSIAIQLLRNPKILVLDEPDSGLDRSSRKKLYSILKGLNDNLKTTIILSTHFENNLDLHNDEEMDIYEEPNSVINGAVEMWRKRESSSMLGFTDLPERDNELVASNSDTRVGFYNSRGDDI